MPVDGSDDVFHQISAVLDFRHDPVGIKLAVCIDCPVAPIVAMTTQVSGEVIPSDVPGSLAFAVRQPAGVVLGIAPWNAPVIPGVRAIAVPLACGNTVVLKASESCPATHRLIGTVLREAVLGDGVVNVVTNAPADAPAIVEALIGHSAVRRVNFTGSTRVGRIVVSDRWALRKGYRKQS